MIAEYWIEGVYAKNWMDMRAIILGGRLSLSREARASKSTSEKQQWDWMALLKQFGSL